MSDTVQYKMETMTEELDEMIRVKLFSIEEVRKLRNKRRNFEYKIASGAKDEEDYKNYIQHEVRLLELIKLRRSKMTVQEKKGSIEHKIIKRVKSLYETAVQRFPEDVTLCMAFFNFSRQANYLVAAENAIQTLLLKHPNRAEVWQIAARFYIYDKKDTSLALRTLDKGRALHKGNKTLYEEAIKIEIVSFVGHKDVSKLENIPGDNQIGSLCLQRLDIYFKDIFQHVDDASFFINQLKFLEKYKFTNEIQQKIIKHIQDKFSNIAVVWHAIAQRERNADIKSTTKIRLGLCSDIYKQGLLAVSAEQKAELWNYFLEFLIDFTHEDLGVSKVTKAHALKEAFSRAFEEGYLGEKYIEPWLELDLDEAEAEALLEQVTTVKFPQSVNLWKLRLQYVITKCSDKDDFTDDKVDAVFRSSLATLQDKALPMFTGMIRYKMLSGKSEEVESLYKQGVKQAPAIAQTLKCQYIEWLSVFGNIHKTRNTYQELAKMKPYCKELHNTMSQIEMAELQFNGEAWGAVHELACDQFGDKDIDVWLNHLMFYVQFNKKAPNAEQRIASIKGVAALKLPGPLFTEFNDKWKKMSVHYDTKT